MFAEIYEHFFLNKFVFIHPKSKNSATNLLYVLYIISFFLQHILNLISLFYIKIKLNQHQELHNEILIVSAATPFKPTSLNLTNDLIYSKISSEFSSFYTKILLFLSFHIWYIWTFHPILNSLEINAFPLNLCTTQVNFLCQSRTALLSSLNNKTIFQTTFEYEQSKNKWSLDSSFCLHRMHNISLLIPMLSICQQLVAYSELLTKLSQHV